MYFFFKKIGFKTDQGILVFNKKTQLLIMSFFS
jgi:hypothetical protein